LGNYENCSIAEILKHQKTQGRSKLQELAEKYNDLEKINKLAMAQQGVNEVAGIMTTNIQKMLDNQKDLNVFLFFFLKLMKFLFF